MLKLIPQKDQSPTTVCRSNCKRFPVVEAAKLEYQLREDTWQTNNKVHSVSCQSELGKFSVVDLKIQDLTFEI